MTAPHKLVAMSLGTALVIVIALPLVEANAQRPRPTVTPRISNCDGTITSTVSSTQIRACDVISVTAKAKPVCQGCNAGINVVFVQIKVNPSGIDKWLEDAPIAVLDLLSRMNRSDIKAAVVQFDDSRAVVSADLTNELERLEGPLRALRVGAIGSTRTKYIEAAGLAVKLLQEGRKAVQTGDEPCEIVIYLAHNSLNQTQAWENQIQAGKLIRQAGATLIAGCPWQFDFDQEVCNGAKGMVTSRRYYVQAPRASDLSGLVGSILDDFTNDSTSRLQSLSLLQRLPAGLEYIDGSVSEPASSVTTQGAETHLLWDWDPVPNTDAHAVTYRVRPLGLGVHSIEGAMRVVDKARGEREVPMPSRPITVSGLCLPDTPTTAPTATDTPTPTPSFTPSPTSTATATPTATATVTPMPAALFLPLLLRERCVPDVRRVDVVMAVDASTSMTDLTPAGRTKLDTAIAAVRTFLGQLRFDRGDKAAIIAFNASATLLTPLTGDRATLDAALGTIQTAQQTCLVCAVDTAAAELTGVRHVMAHAPVLVLLTDGRSNPRPASEAVARAVAARATGVTIYTIGLGSDAEAESLAAIASRPEWYYPAPNTEALADIYRRIAVELPCPAGAFWGGR